MVNLDNLARAGFKFVDVLSALDCIVTKPGYGTVSEAIFHNVPTLYAVRTNFAEGPMLVRALRDHVPAEEVPFDSVVGGSAELFAAATRVRDARDERRARVAPEGNAQAAEHIVRWAFT